MNEAEAASRRSPYWHAEQVCDTEGEVGGRAGSRGIEGFQ